MPAQANLVQKAVRTFCLAALACAALMLSPRAADAQFVQQGSKLVGTGANGSGDQGTSVALSADGNTAVVGGYFDNSGAGAAWVFTRAANGAWSQQGSKLVGTGAIGAASQGWSAALSADGKTAILGGYSDDSFSGAAWIFTRASNGTWSQQGTKLVGAGAIGAAQQGVSVALSADGNTAIVGGSVDNSNAGAVWIFTRDSNGSWSQQAKLTGSDAVGAASQGWSVALSADGNTAIFGGNNDNSSAGAAWVFTRDVNGNWSQQGNKLVGTGAAGSARQGSSVSLSADGNTAIVGGNSDNSNTGAAWVFTRDNNSVWSQQGNKLVGAGAIGHASQATSVALSSDGSTAIMGGLLDNSNVGATWVFRRDGSGSWNQEGSKLVGDGTVGVARQGASVALSADGNAAIVGGYFDNSGAGAAWVFVRPPQLSSVSPGSSPTEGGALTSILGSDLTGASVTFGGVDAAATYVINDTTIIAFTPPHAAGTVPVVVTTSGGSTTWAGTFSYNVPTGALVTSSDNPSSFGQSVTLTAFVGGNGGTPTGTVTFKDGAATLGIASLSSGSASLSTSALDAGSHSITAVYGGNATFAAATSAALTQTVQQGATNSTLTASPNPTTPGRAVKLVATVAAVAPAAGTPAGTVTFRDGAAVLGTRSLSGGSASLTTAAFGIGGHKITASYGGSTNWAPSSATPVTETVNARVGTQFQVNTSGGDKSNPKQLPAVAALAKGSYVAVWQAKGEDGSGYGIYGQRFASNAAKAGGEFKVNTTTAGDQTQPAIATLADGGFIVVWTSNGEDGSGLGVYAQRYSKTGAKSGAEFRVNTTTTQSQFQPSVAALADGGFVAAWTSMGQDGSGLGIYAQRFNTYGAKVGGEFRVNTTTSGNQTTPSVAVLGTGFVVVWASNQQSQFGFDVYGQRFNSAGARLGGEFIVNSSRSSNQIQPVAASSSIGFVVAWTSAGQDGSGLGVYAQRFNPTGAKLGGEFRVNRTTASNQSEPSLASFPDGGFLVAWTSLNQDGSGKGVYAQGYDKNGNPLNVEFRVNTTTANDEWQPRAAALATTTFVVMWAQSNAAAIVNIEGQRFTMKGL